jgi:CubicO group peptidase (beta-lactamase class C family)
MSAPAPVEPSLLGEVLRGWIRPLVAGGHAPGAVAGAVHGGHAVVVCEGLADRAARRPMTVGTACELGSASKTFTGLLLAEMVARGEVGHDDPVADHLPPHAVPSDPVARRVTLADLATHTAGVPRTPGRVYRTMLRTGWTDPYAGYDVEDLYRTTARLRPRRPGRYRYSSLGYGVLGCALAHTAGRDYADLLAARVLHPLGLRATATRPGTVPDEATGYHRGRPSSPWTFAALAPAGAVRTTGTDLLRYLRAQLYPGTTPLPGPLRDTHRPRRDRANGDAVCLAWFHRVVRDRPLLWHEGATRGFSTFIGLSPTTGTGVFLLANTMPTGRHPTIRAARRAFNDLLFTR